MIKGMKEVIERWKSEDVWYFDDLASVECPGYRVSDEIYIGDGILRIVFK